MDIVRYRYRTFYVYTNIFIVFNDKFQSCDGGRERKRDREIRIYELVNF